MEVNQTPLEDLFVIEPKVFNDDRGFFYELFKDPLYEKLNLKTSFVQDNHSRSSKGILRGMHYQVNNPQSQLVTVLRGKIFDVAVDLRPNSKTFCKWFGVELSDSGPRQMYMGPGFAHGFYVMSDFADLHYKVSCLYNSNDEGGLIWNDSTIGITWPNFEPSMSERDKSYPSFMNIPNDKLPKLSKDVL